MALSFAFDANQMTPEMLAQRRRVEEMLMGRTGRAQNIGEGIGDLFSGLAAGISARRTNQMEGNARSEAMSQFQNSFFQPFGGGQPSPAGGPAPQQPNPALQNPTLNPMQQSALPQTTSAPQSDSWLQYSNAGAIRNKPINENLQKSLSFLPEMGVSMNVFSGGQDDQRRTGSKRHDDGNAADVFFMKGGKRLDWRNQADVPILQEIVKRAKANGVTGFGAGDGYMQPGSMHIGFGAPAVWGAGGKGANAPAWLRAAYEGGGQGNAMVQPAGMQGQGDPNQSRMMQLQQLIANPFLPKEMQALAVGEMERLQQEADPMRQMQLQKTQLELQQMQAPPQMSPYEAAQLKLREQEMNRPQVLGEGSRVYDPSTKSIVVDSPPKQAPKPAEVAEYEYAKQQGFPGSFMDYQASKKGGMRLDMDPATGAITFQQGSNIKPMTEGQSKDATFSTRAEGALKTLEPLSTALTEITGSTVGQVPYIGNYAKSGDYQKAEQAGNEFLQALLRKDTGATITPQEKAEYGSVYLPAPGDGPETLIQKKESRYRALAALKAGMTPQAILAQSKALASGVPPQEPVQQPKGPLPDVTFGGDGKPLTWSGDVDVKKLQELGFTQEEWSVLTPEEKKALMQ